MASNLPEGKIAVMLTREQVEFMIDNCEKNETFAMNQLLAWGTLDGDALEAIKSSFLKLDEIKNQFRELRLALMKAE